MICAQIGSPIADGSSPISAAVNQPADLSTCAVVLVTGQELSALTGVAFPSPTDFGTVWAFGFFLVVGSYVVSWGAGTVLRFFK